MNRREFLKTAVVGAVAATCPASVFGAVVAKERRPNILFFFPDQHRYDWTSVNPAMPDITPNLKQLAREGSSFSRAFCPSPLCAPSRSCLALGKEYDGCGVNGNEDALALDRTTVYKMLRDRAGYHVLGCGKFDLDKPGQSWGLDGKHRRKGLPSLLDAWGFSDGIDNAGKQDGAGTTRPEPYHAYLASVTGAASPDETYTDNWIARNGLELIKAAPKGKPWFLQINFNGPHPPFDPTDTMLAKWEKTSFPPTVPENRNDLRERRKYAAEIHNIDRWIGVYRKELDKRGEQDNTIIVYSSDHGEMLGDHGYEGKSRPLSPSACVPLVMAGPGIKGNRTYTNAAETLDLAATFLDYAGVPMPEGMDSKSMRPYLEARGDYPRAHATCALDGWSLVCDGRYKLITGSLAGKVQSKDKDKSSVLYDLQNDPAETVDVSAANPEVVMKLKPLLPPCGKRGKERKKQ